MKTELNNIRIHRNDPPLSHPNPTLILEERGGFAPDELILVFYPDREVKDGQIVATIYIDRWLPEETKAFLIETLKGRFAQSNQ
jgi:hypothetical protein